MTNMRGVIYATESANMNLLVLAEASRLGILNDEDQESYKNLIQSLFGTLIDSHKLREEEKEERKCY